MFPYSHDKLSLFHLFLLRLDGTNIELAARDEMSQKIFLSIRIVRRHLGIGGKVAKSVFCTTCAILTQTISHSADTTEPMREMSILE